MTTSAKPKAEAVRVLNDNFRTTFIGGQVLMTSGVNELPVDVKAQALLMVKDFKEFTTNNDPYGEHDFGVIEIGDQTVYWKIDYYDQNCQFGSEDPADPEKTTRVLTIMLAHEY